MPIASVHSGIARLFPSLRSIPAFVGRNLELVGGLQELQRPLDKKGITNKIPEVVGKSLNFSSPVDDTRTTMNRSFTDIVLNFNGYYWYFTDIAPVGGMP